MNKINTSDEKVVKICIQRQKFKKTFELVFSSNAELNAFYDDIDSKEILHVGPITIFTRDILYMEVIS